MPVYDFCCPKCGFVRSDLRITHDVTPPTCTECLVPMERQPSAFSFSMK